eukprot:3389004-Prymnesium_polylepis.1
MSACAWQLACLLACCRACANGTSSPSYNPPAIIWRSARSRQRGCVHACPHLVVGPGSRREHLTYQKEEKKEIERGV